CYRDRREENARGNEIRFHEGRWVMSGCRLTNRAKLRRELEDFTDRRLPQQDGAASFRRRADSLSIQPTMSGRPRIVIIVASMVATEFSVPSESIYASAWHTVIVRPARTTRPRAMSSAPRAGARKFVLNSNVSTPAPCGMRLNA